MNLVILLDLTYITCAESLNFTLFKGKMSKFFLIFTYNQGKIFLILPITQGQHMYTWSRVGVAPSL